MAVHVEDSITVSEFVQRSVTLEIGKRRSNPAPSALDDMQDMILNYSTDKLLHVVCCR
jgi:hypothetical protein